MVIYTNNSENQFTEIDQLETIFYNIIEKILNVVCFLLERVKPYLLEKNNNTYACCFI